MSSFIFLFLLISITFSEKTNPSKDDTRNLQSDDEFDNIRIYINYNCFDFKSLTSAGK